MLGASWHREWQLKTSCCQCNDKKQKYVFSVFFPALPLPGKAFPTAISDPQLSGWSFHLTSTSATWSSLLTHLTHLPHHRMQRGTQRKTVSTGHRRWSTMTQRSYSLHSLHCNALQYIEQEPSRMAIVTLHLSHLPCHTYICFTHQQCVVLRKRRSTKVIVEFSCSRPESLRPRSNCRPCLNISAHVTTCTIAHQHLSHHLHL